MAPRRSSCSIKEKERMIKILQDNLHLNGPNQGKPNFYKVFRNIQNIVDQCLVPIKRKIY